MLSNTDKRRERGFFIGKDGKEKQMSRLLYTQRETWRNEVIDKILDLFAGEQATMEDMECILSRIKYILQNTTLEPLATPPTVGVGWAVSHAPPEPAAPAEQSACQDATTASPVEEQNVPRQ